MSLHVKFRLLSANWVMLVLTVGCSRNDAAALVGCSVATIKNEQERDAEFLSSLVRAEAEGKLLQIRKLQNSDDWRAALAWLSRKYPEEWSEMQRVKMQHSGGVNAGDPGIEVVTDENWYNNQDRLKPSEN